MIPYEVFPMFELGPLHFNMYGLMFALGFITVLFLAAREAQKKGIQKKVIENLAICLFVGSLIGARLLFVFFYWLDKQPITFWGIFKIWEGGLAFFGGFIGALVVGFFYVRLHKLEFWKFADIFTFPLIVGHILGRLGDYFTGGHPGKITDLPWAIYLEGALRHPVVLYEIIGLVLIGTIIYHLKKTQRFDGFIFLVYVQLYSVQRFILDFFRIEPTTPTFSGLTPVQYLTVALFIVAGYVAITKYRKKSIKVVKIHANTSSSGGM